VTWRWIAAAVIALAGCEKAPVDDAHERRPMSAPADARRVPDARDVPDAPVAIVDAAVRTDARKPDKITERMNAERYVNMMFADDSQSSGKSEMMDRSATDLDRQLTDVRVGAKLTVTPDKAFSATTLTGDAVARKIRAVYVRHLQRCVRPDLEASRRPELAVELDVTVGLDGHVSRVHAAAPSSKTSACLEKAMRRWRFPSPMAHRMSARAGFHIRGVFFKP
jgi:outer membrane biosynthesis protein TonB